MHRLFGSHKLNVKPYLLLSPVVADVLRRRLSYPSFNYYFVSDPESHARD